MMSFFLRLCDKIDPDSVLDKAGFFANTAGNFENVVQYNKDNRAFEVILLYVKCKVDNTMELF